MTVFFKGLDPLIAAILLFFPLVANAYPSVFLQQASEKISKFTQVHPGLVLIKDLQNQEIWKGGQIEMEDQSYLPGSLTKLITAQVAVEEQIFPDYVCKGKANLEGKSFYCWTHKGHGSLNFSQALVESCNLYFLNLFSKVSWQKWKDHYLRYFEKHSNTLEKSLPLSIGEDKKESLTPVQVFNFWSQYYQLIQNPKYSVILDSLERNSSQGTLKRLKYKMLGKSGTSDSRKQSFKTDAWILGAYPIEKPRYLILVFLRQAYAFKEAVDLLNEVLPLLDENTRETGQ